MRSVAFLLAGALIAASPADAHGIWFASRGGQAALVYGIGADDLDMVRRLPLVDSVAAFDAAGRPMPAALRSAGPIVVVDTGPHPALLVAVLNNGIWSKRAGGSFEKKGRDEMPDAIRSERTVKYAVAVQGALARPIPVLPTQILQIIPAAPLPDRLGTPLRYTVLFDGRPVKGARVIADMLNNPDATEVATGADGTVTLPVRNQGLNVVRAVFDGPSDDPAKYDRIEHTATLAYTLPHAPE